MNLFCAACSRCFLTMPQLRLPAKPECQRVSSACYIADAFPASLYLAWKYADNFEAGIVANTNLGGDNCHRGAVVGALLGAAVGVAGIPARFCEGLHAAPALQRNAHLWTEDLHEGTPKPGGL